ncbi:SDR family oxidoreductase [soil metagenome]
MKTPSRQALVTGANRGIGLEFIRQLLAHGDRVVATCREPGKAAVLNTLAGEHPGRLHVLPLDVSEPKAHAQLARELPLVLGESDGQGAGQLDLLVNNAGVLHAGERFGALGAAHLEHSFRVNAMGPLLLSQALAPLLADGARIANLSSQLGSIGNLGRFGTPSYNISKAAQNMVTALLASALSERDIVVLALHPGWVRTQMGGEDAEITPQEAVAGLLETIDAATAPMSGGFYDWKGEPMPW